MNKEGTKYLWEQYLSVPGSAKEGGAHSKMPDVMSMEFKGVKKSHLNIMVWVLLPYIMIFIQQVSKCTLPN